MMSMSVIILIESMDLNQMPCKIQFTAQELAQVI